MRDDPGRMRAREHFFAHAEGDRAANGGLHLPQPLLDVYGPVALAALALGGPVTALLGALLPAGWAARTATALRTEQREFRPRSR
ncbi:hypothetical protein TPA0908_09190 [Micromonospora sp. AKA38]|nr:hypothetical protein TPA0908_09190 [Micromonospora sp. AKA38]